MFRSAKLVTASRQWQGRNLELRKQDRGEKVDPHAESLGDLVHSPKYFAMMNIHAYPRSQEQILNRWLSCERLSLKLASVSG